MKSIQVLLGCLALLLSGCGDDASFKVLGSTKQTASAVLESLRLPLKMQVRVPSGTPTSFKVTLFSAHISASADCSNPILLQDYGASGQEFEMFSSPTLFSGSPADGTYACLILTVNDTMKFKADQEAVDAHAGCANTTTEYTFDVYRDGNSDDGDWIDLAGASIDATGSRQNPGIDKVVVFASTSTTAGEVKANGNAAHGSQRLTLSSAMVVPGQTTYFWDATDGVENANDGGGDFCWIENVTSGFR